ncbi:histone lysine demethylase PHF8-like [Macrosteles quadrilineatus]|uniref:histone lysine demethylase PHF8-like n=1 Tax=Macrosteles quadrilineatus TaxID=74068 RepID=UPI0023E09406|nr:histone lysine demethylase PHF8-like [Macrosteles quadrilineatus]
MLNVDNYIYTEMEVSKEIYCICGKPYDEKQFMIQCDNCREWYHGNCVNVREYVSIDLDKYHCPQCEVACGPSVFKKQYNFHRHNYSDMEAENKPVQTGTPVFVEELKTRHFPSADPVVTRLTGNQLTLNHLYQNGFDQPIIVDEKEGLDLRVPSEYFTVQDVEALVGSDREVDVIDVARQTDIKMTVGDFVSYFNNPMRQRVLNLISLEFSDTKLSELVEAPYVARKLDWVNTVWPLSIGTLPTVYKRPEVQKYCLIGVKDSYTDFHIDFGGTSVWYHVLRGEKIFYLIKPTMANLSLYQRWMTSSTQHETFFGDQVDCCYRCIVPAGHTMMIPTGWIHAVLTPVDTLVFGGNFLHSLNIPMQLQIYEIEKKMRTPGKFRFPAFETINWYAAKQLCEELRMLNDESSKVPAYLLQGVKALLVTLKQWSQDRDTNKSRKEEIPSIIDGPKLLKDLSKEIRHAEKYLNSLHPPKPERESKRKKKKPVNKDFVDYSQPQNSILLAQMKMEPKEPIKLNMKVLNKKLQIKEEPIVRPPLKLTLPKPVMYPYTTPLSENKLKKEENIDQPGAENKPWFITMDRSRHIKIKAESNGLKVKLAKQAEMPFINLPPNPPVHHSFQDDYLDPKDQIDSVYDFHDDEDYPDDDDDNCLTIDETPKKKRWSKGSATVEQTSSSSLKAKWAQANQSQQIHLNNLLMNLKGIKTDNLNSVDVTSNLPKNGIDELLKASAYTREGSPRIEDIESGRTSPSTREAIAGMLSISRMYQPEGEASSSHHHGSSRSKKRKHHTPHNDEVEDMDKVHQDDDFIYPSLDLSDEEEERTSRGGKRKVDEAWNPKARVGHVAPKTDRPCREGAKKQSVEKGLEAAAAKRARLPSPKRPYHRKRPKFVPIPSVEQPSSSQSNVLPSSSCRPTVAVTTSTIDLKNRKPKKGMATAKQRLGKILKLHKVYH